MADAVGGSELILGFARRLPRQVLGIEPAEIDRVLARGAEKARAIADPVLAETYKAVGFLPVPAT